MTSPPIHTDDTDDDHNLFHAYYDEYCYGLSILSYTDAPCRGGRQLHQTI